MILREMTIKIENRTSFSTFDKIKTHDCIMKSFASATKSYGGSDDGDDN